MSTYSAKAERDGRFWLVTVAGVGVTQARHLREVELMARDLVAVMREVKPDSFGLEVELALPASVDKHIREAARLRALAMESNAAAARRSRDAARELREAGLTVRDVGEVLGVSHQRAHQLVKS